MPRVGQFRSLVGLYILLSSGGGGEAATGSCDSSQYRNRMYQRISKRSQCQGTDALLDDVDGSSLWLRCRLSATGPEDCNGIWLKPPAWVLWPPRKALTHDWGVSGVKQVDRAWHRFTSHRQN